MALLKFENGDSTTDLSRIQNELAPLNIKLDHWPVGDNTEVKMLLDKPALAPEEKDQVLAGVDQYFQKLKTELGYQDRDLVVLHPELEGLDGALAKFEKVHTHDDDEVRYIVEGEGIFGFIRPDDSQVALTVQAEEYINVPKDTEHWFILTESKRIKAVRYFTTMDAWTPVYTETEKRI